MKHILFVCSGNTCRSPMAEALLRHRLEAKNNALDIPCKVQSAGIFAAVGLPASSEALQVMTEYGVDLGSHRSQVLNPKLLEWADLVLTMTDSHRKHILSQYVVNPNKVHTLGEYTGVGRIDVVDPFGLGIEAYRQCADQIQLLIESILKRIL